MPSPPGFVPEGFEPDQAPSAAPGKAAASAPAPNAVQAFKDWLLRVGTQSASTDPALGGAQGQPDVAPWNQNQGIGGVLRNVGQYALPGSWPGLIATGASMIPGAGVAPTLARLGTAAGGSAAAEYLRGADPGAAALEGGLGALVGEGVGGITRAIGRNVSAAMGPKSLPGRFGSFAAEQSPEAAGGLTGEAVLGRMVGGDWQRTLSQQYRDGVASALAGLPPDTRIPVPSLVELGQKGDIKGVPGLFDPQEALTAIESIRRNLGTVTGDLSRRKLALTDITRLDRAEEELAAGLTKAAQGTPVAEDLAAASAAYAKGKALFRMLTGGRDTLTKGQSEKFLQGGAFERGQQLEMNQLRQQADLTSKLAPDAAQTLEDLVRRGETLPLAISQPAQVPHFRYHLGFIPTVSGLYHAPRPIGATVPGIAAGVTRPLATDATLNTMGR